MKLKGRLLRNLAAVFLLSWVLMAVNGLYFTPLAAFEASERGANYGPSTVAWSIDTEDGIRYFSRYLDTWSVNNVKRVGPFWRFGNRGERLIDPSTPVQVYRGGDMQGLFYGCRSDPAVVRLELVAGTESVWVDQWVEDLFLCKVGDAFAEQILLRAYDAAGTLLYEAIF